MVNMPGSMTLRTFASRYPKGSFGKEDTLGANSGFPRHKELFNEHYYEGGREDEPDPTRSPLNDAFEKMNSAYKDDAIEYDGQTSTERGPHIEGGVLQNVHSIMGQTVEDIMEGDYWKAKKDMAFQAAEYFNNISKNERDMMANTKNFVTRSKLNREIDFTEDFRKKYMTKEYGHYEKYEKNKVETAYDDGQKETMDDKFYEHYMQMLARLPTRET